jgi:hypothetical protein
MIETLFARASSSARLLEPPLGSYLESLAQTLQGQSYSREVIRSYVYAAHRFGEWLSKQGLPLSAVSDQLISRYIDQFPKRITLAHPYGQRLAKGGVGLRNCRWETRDELRVINKRVNATVADSNGQRNRKPEEPDARIGRVRICGGAFGGIRGATRHLESLPVSAM